MFNSQYYTCEQIDQRLLQGYVDDFNEVNSTNYSKEDLLLKLFQAINWDQVFGKYEESSEFVRLYLDVNKKVLWGIRANGDIYYGAGVPSQIKTYISSKISELHLDRVGDILVFLDDLIEGDKTLQELLNEKVDKEEGKSLIDAEYASGVQYIENPEFVSVKLDSNDKILEATRKDGTKLLGWDLLVNNNTFFKGFIDFCGVIHKVINNPEFIRVETDLEGKIVNAIRKDGDVIYGGVNINELKRDFDLEVLAVECEENNIYTIEHNDSTVTLEYDELTGIVYSVIDAKSHAEISMDDNGNIYIEQ